MIGRNIGENPRLPSLFVYFVYFVVDQQNFHKEVKYEDGSLRGRSAQHRGTCFFRLSGGRGKAEEGRRNCKRRKAVGQESPGWPFSTLYEPRLAQPAEEDCGLDPPPIAETILIDQGRYVARSYRIDGYLAMWLVAVGIVQFYDDRGRMLTTINLFESLRPEKMAA